MTNLSSGSASWPAQDLEFLHQCPCCGTPDREIQLEGMRDFVTGNAPGEWSLWRCYGCRCAYLDPRPTEASIGRAYSTYYTHEQKLPLPVYLRREFRARASVALWKWSQSGWPLHVVQRHARGRNLIRKIASRVRYLPIAASRAQRVLDVGFGSGEFLELARLMGYQATGIDFDPEVVEVARSRGLDVFHAAMPGSGLPLASFDHITLGNVLEHLHSPVEALRELLTLLRPGGRLWIEQPNLNARGLEEFGIYWRGLEAPRHLTLWSPDGLVRLLGSVGFVNSQVYKPEASLGRFYYAQSRFMQSGQFAIRQQTIASTEDYDLPADPSRSEAITLSTFRSS